MEINGEVAFGCLMVAVHGKQKKYSVEKAIAFLHGKMNLLGHMAETCGRMGELHQFDQLQGLPQVLPFNEKAFFLPFH